MKAPLNLQDTYDTADIAALLRYSRRYVAERLSKRADFPRPAVMVSQRKRLWWRREIDHWATTQ